MKSLKTHFLYSTSIFVLLALTTASAEAVDFEPGNSEVLPAASIPNYEQANLTSSTESIDDTLGFSVAIDGDTIATGAPFEDSNATGINGDQSNDSSEDSGAAYVFTRSGTTWSQPVFLKASNTDPGDEFGYSVAISGDTMVVGAPYEGSNATGVNGDQADNSVREAGAVYVFIRSGNIWSQQAYIKASNTGSNYDHFGYSVAIDGDTLIVGAPGDWSNADGINGDQTNNSSPKAGAVYVFTRSSAIWSQQAYIKASNSSAYDEFGRSVSFSGNTLAVGAPYEWSNATGVNGDQTNNTLPRAGAVYVFNRSGATWSQQAYVKASNTNSYFYFGESVSINGEMLVVGSPWVDSITGAAYIFSRTGVVWTQDAYLQASNKDNGDYFGKSVTISGDTVVVGAFEESSSGKGLNGFQDDNSSVARPYSGAAYLFTRNGVNWFQQLYIKASDPHDFDKFGWAVALSGETLAVGAQMGGTFFGGGGPGAVYVFAYTSQQPLFLPLIVR